MSAFETQSLTISYGKKMIINEINLEIPKGEITVFIGSNGCGKTTLLRALARLLKPEKGSILIEGKSIFNQSTKEVAKQLSLLPQGLVAPEGLTVLQLVKQGRYPHQNWLQQWSHDDEKAVFDALAATGMSELKEAPVDLLSGGQKQRAWIAMVLAQETDIILLDEPTTYLDLNHQIEILDLLLELNQIEKRTIVMILHDLNLACRYAHQIIAIKDKKIIAQGPPESIISPTLVQNVFHIKCEIITDPLFGTPLCIPHSKGRSLIDK